MSSTRIRPGFNARASESRLSAEHGLTDDRGLFSRPRWNNGQSETFTFTEVDRIASLGLSCKGTHWNRPNDAVALGGIISGLSKDRRGRPGVRAGRTGD